ncbi:NAD(P)H-hydrate dehydratase [Paenarthrobacter sp. Z7-10]|uniref:NAD(P)H-hydrate dehydratase n=1 Tax=Paenarthrobacter sp. Z7-10 TaxID=2787635 RepID=UPI002E7843E5|nr:NAD(P)H-hydrate dehydratase [Paenarthrobacter sp. Z7-10]
MDDARQTTELQRCVGALAGPATRLVLDAYALGVLRGLGEVYEPWAGRLVLTPNRAEAARLLDSEGVPMPQAVPAIAEKYRAVVTGQGIIASPEGDVWTVAAGNPGLGTSGSGDVLAGAVGGFLARELLDAMPQVLSELTF